MSFLEHGWENLGVVDPDWCRDILSLVKQVRPVADHHYLFMSEGDFRAQPNRYGTNPKPGRNLMERFPCNKITATFRERLTEVLGHSFSVLMGKFVCGLPSVPDWVDADIKGNPAANLGAYIRPEFRDMTYFRGIAPHQDIIDYQGRLGDFLTVYTYLDDVAEKDAPLFIMPGSHAQGAHIFPHDLRKEMPTEDPGDFYLYNGKQLVENICLTGPAGTTNMWHSCLLHGTQPVSGSNVRISVRFLLQPQFCEMDELNGKIQGALSLPVTRVDVDDKHVPVKKVGNILSER